MMNATKQFITPTTDKTTLSLTPLIFEFSNYSRHSLHRIPVFVSLVLINRSLFDFENWDFGFCNRTRNPKTDFTFEKSILKVDFSKEIQIRISWISFLTFDWKSKKGLVFFLLITRAHARTAACKNCFSNPFSDFPKKPTESNNSCLSIEIYFQISRSIANLKSGF